MLRFLALAAAACAITLQGEEAKLTQGQKAILKSKFETWLKKHPKAAARVKAKIAEHEAKK